MKTLLEHNTERKEFYTNNPPSGNGIECPVCKQELYDTFEKVNPPPLIPKIGVKYLNTECNWEGYRFE